MDSDLVQLLSEVAIPSDINHPPTHVLLGGRNLRYHVSPAQRATFWSKYCDLVEKIYRDDEPISKANICLAEIPEATMPAMLQLTLSFDTKTEDGFEPYGDDFLKYLTFCYQTALLELYNIDQENIYKATVVVSESADHWCEITDHTMIMEIKLQIPYARVDSAGQERLKTKTIELLRKFNVMGKLERSPIGDWTDIVTTGTLNQPVPMYGSHAMFDRPKLTVTHIWGVIPEDLLESDWMPDQQEPNTYFPLTNHAHIHEGMKDFFYEGDFTYDHWFPLLLSVRYYSSILMSRKQNDSPAWMQPTNISINPTGHVFGSGSINDGGELDLELAQRFIRMLSADRFIKEPFWLDIGRALYSTDEGGDAGLKIWITLTRARLTAGAAAGLSNSVITTDGATPPFMLGNSMSNGNSLENTCRELYPTFSTSNVTIRTLAWCARQDAEPVYNVWHREWCLSALEKALSVLHTDVAVALYRVYWLDFTYAPGSGIRGGRWYRFKKRWFEMNEGIELRKLISKDFVKRFEYAQADVSRLIAQSSDQQEKDRQVTMKKIGAVICKLKTTSFKSSIMREASEHFARDGFMALLDTNSELTGVLNGIIEVHGTEASFRQAKPEDFISMCAGVDYREDYSFNHPLVRDTLKWLSQVFTDSTLLHHFMKFAASCLKGRNSDKIFPIFTGEGDNSKSMIVKLFETTFLQYCMKFDMSNITSTNTNSSGPTPQLARARGARLAFLDEPEDDSPLRKGVLKRWTGGDSFFARMLQDNGADVQVTFKLVLTCNKVPVIPNADKAMKNRTRIFPFTSTWVDDASNDENEQKSTRRFKKNPHFEHRIPVLAPAFMWLLTQYYTPYATEGLVDPEVVVEHTQAYWRDNDVYAQFATDSIQEVLLPNGERDISARATLNDIYCEFKSWFKESFPNAKIPQRPDMRSELVSRWGHMSNGAWHGIRIVTDQNISNVPLGSTKNGVRPGLGKATENNGINSLFGTAPRIVIEPPKPTSVEIQPEKLIFVEPAKPLFTPLFYGDRTDPKQMYARGELPEDGTSRQAMAKEAAIALLDGISGGDTLNTISSEIGGKLAIFPMPKLIDVPYRD